MMHTRLLAQDNAATTPVFTAAPRGLLQPKCACGASPGLAGECDECGQKPMTLRRQTTGQSEPSTVPPIVHDVLRSPGQPLDPATREFFEPHFGHDFSRVSIYASSPNQVQTSAAISAPGDVYEQEADTVALDGVKAPADEQGVRAHVGKAVGFDFSNVRVHREASEVEAQGAHAVAEGANIYLAPGRYRPDLPVGRALLAHELAHVAQQSAVSRLPGPGSFREALGHLGEEESSARLAERAGTIGDPQINLTAAPLGMRQRCVAGCNSCSKEEDSGGPTKQDAPSAAAATTTPQPTHAAGPSQAAAGNKIVRLSWTVDDGPTPLTPGMSSALSPRAATWFIMSNQLGTGTNRSNALTQLKVRQKAGDEIGIHSMHPTVAHSAWFPINLGTAVPKGYNTTAAAMTDLTAFTSELRTSGLAVHFGRMPGGELSEIKKYVEDQGGSTSTSDSVARALLSGSTPTPAAPATVAKDVSLVVSTLKTLNLHLWGGSASGPEVTSNTWEAESSGVPSRTDDVVRRFKGVVNKLAAGTRTTPGSFVILSHDTTQADITQAGANIAAMETYAVSKGVRVEYYRMADLYQLLRGKTP